MQPVYAEHSFSKGNKLLDKFTSYGKHLEVCSDIVVVVVGKTHQHVLTVGRVTSRHVIWKNSRMDVNRVGGGLGRSKVKTDNGVLGSRATENLVTLRKFRVQQIS